MAGSLDLTDSDLSDLFDRYPDINFDTAEDFVPTGEIGEHFSSPSSANTNNHDTPPPKNGTSTAHTTPNWPRTRDIDGCGWPSLETFLADVDAIDLPSMSKEGFKSLARGMTKLGSLLVSDAGELNKVYLDSNRPKIQNHTQSIVRQLRQSRDTVKDELDSIDFVKTRAPFMVEPTMPDLWCNYRQRAKLIAE